MKFSLTQEDIDNGKHDSETHCPLANMLRRMYPTKRRIELNYKHYWCESERIIDARLYGNGFKQITFPNSIANKIYKWDHEKGELLPFEWNQDEKGEMEDEG